MAERGQEKGWIWDRYWQADRIASCFDGAGETNYPPQLAKGWTDLFDRLPDGASVLDLCTGNGAIPLLAVQSARARGVRLAVVGVDRARVEPTAHVPRLRELLGDIRFHAGVSAEKLPFPDATFDAVTSQYGLEYTHTARTVREAARVARPGAALRVVIHAADGRVARASASHLEELRWLESLELSGLAAEAIDRALKAERSPGMDRRPAQAAVDAFSAALAAVHARLPQLLNPAMARNAVDVLADCFHRRDFQYRRLILEKVAEVRVELAAHRGRLEALVAAARDPAATRALADQFAAAGFTDMAVREVTDASGALVGRELTGTAHGVRTAGRGEPARSSG
jgi:ubiquinone/menaquinone biosynthesis C-methylase UbiE